MEHRKEINDKLVQWILNKVKTEYANDISLVLIYGSYINGTANHKSDVDCYYIPKTERAYNLSLDFIIEGVGYDIFPISWERVERIADLQESSSPLVGDVKIIYSNSKSDIERFQIMQARLKRNLLNDEYVRKIAEKRCEEASRRRPILNQTHKASEIRKTAGFIIMTLADAVAVYNHDYYHFGPKKQFENLQNNFPNVPKNIIDGYKNVIEAIDINDVVKHTKKLFNDVYEYLGIPLALQEIPENKSAATGKINAPLLAKFYEEVSSTFNKVYVCCETGNYIVAFLSAACLQQELDGVKDAGCPSYELLKDFNYKELGKLSEAAQKIEEDFVRLITENGGRIKTYDSFEQFELSRL